MFRIWNQRRAAAWGIIGLKSVVSLFLAAHASLANRVILYSHCALCAVFAHVCLVTRVHLRVFHGLSLVHVVAFLNLAEGNDR